jgi:hypothetical protein
MRIIMYSENKVFPAALEQVIGLLHKVEVIKIDNQSTLYELARDNEGDCIVLDGSTSPKWDGLALAIRRITNTPIFGIYSSKEPPRNTAALDEAGIKYAPELQVIPAIWQFIGEIPEREK